MQEKTKETKSLPSWSSYPSEVAKQQTNKYAINMQYGDKHSRGARKDSGSSGRRIKCCCISKDKEVLSDQWHLSRNPAFLSALRLLADLPIP